LHVTGLPKSTRSACPDQPFPPLDSRLKRRVLCPVHFVKAREKCAAGRTRSLQEAGKEMTIHRSRSPTKFAALFMLALFLPVRAEAPATEFAIAVLDFGYKDTSGEPRDQTAEHQKRLDRFMASLRDDLAANASLRVVSLSCGPDPCSLRNAPLMEISLQARQAGAHFLVFGEVQKVSTLIQMGSYHVLDVETNTPVVDRILSFRGDSDEAWRRAEKFLVKELQDEIRTK